MAISPLPEATVRLLGSTQALTTVTSLVKELIDNALDARATSIDILITPNTLDKIEVRDNGSGIPQEDLDSLGRRGHTSKLRSFEELKTIGGVSLGFRGEALFSAVQLGQVSVATKTEGEQVATSVKLKPLGGVDSQTRVSHPAGTTVTVLNFLARLPVRHQTALKEAPKTIGRIKELLQAYSLARPHVRINLKVTKGGKGSWSFAPRSTDGIKEAVSQIIGRDPSSQCIEKSISFPETGRSADAPENGDTVVEDSDDQLFRCEIFLPRPDADFSKISHGQYISVDGRPVSSDRGTMKRIITTFKRYVRSSVPDTTEKVKNPFLRLAIRCPVGSYDPNVEPAKDDILFCNEYVVLKEVENAFKDVYGRPDEPKQKETDTFNSHSRDFTRTLDNFELLLARQPPASLEAGRRSPIPDSTSDDGDQPGQVFATRATVEVPNDTEPSLSSPKRSRHVDMSRDFNEEMETPPHGPRFPARTQTPFTPEVTPGSKSLNPWLIAKLTAPVRGTIGDLSPGPALYAMRPSRLPPTPQKSSDPVDDDVDLLDPVSPRVRRRQTIDDNDLDLISARQNMGHSRRRSFSGFSGPIAPPYERPMTASTDEDLLAAEGNTVTIHRRNDFTSARNLTTSQQFTPTFQPKGPKRSRTNRPFVSPILQHDRPGPADGFRQTTLTTSETCAARTIYPENNLGEDPDSELAWAMDFETRKEEATRRRKQELRAARLEAEMSAHSEEFLDNHSPPRVIRSSPHKNRYNAAILSLTPAQSPLEASVPVQKVKSNIPDADPRAYFMRRQKSLLKADPTKMSRVKSIRLPLEKIPEGEQLTNIILPLSVDFESVKKSCEDTSKSDIYVRLGNTEYESIQTAVEKGALLNRLSKVVERWKDSVGGEGAEVEYLFENLQFAG